MNVRQGFGHNDPTTPQTSIILYRRMDHRHNKKEQPTINNNPQHFKNKKNLTITMKIT
jgi:hypothetical protein